MSLAEGFPIDLVFIVASYYYAVQLRFGGALTSELSDLFFKVFPLLLAFRVICFIGFGLYGVLIRYLNLYNYLSVIKAVTVGSLLTVSGPRSISPQLGMVPFAQPLTRPVTTRL